MPRLTPRPPQQLTFDALVFNALSSPDAQEVETCVRLIGLSKESDNRREQALLDILETNPSAGNVASACLFHLRALSGEALRRGIQMVLSQDDGFDTDCAKVAALVRLVSIDSPVPDDALLISRYSWHSRAVLRIATQREIKGLNLEQRKQLLEATRSNVPSEDSDARGLELFMRALSAMQ